MLGETLKVSIHNEMTFHDEKPWLLAYTKEHVRSESPLWPFSDRTVARFRPTPFEGGLRRAFAIGVLRTSMRCDAADPREAVVTVADRHDALTVATVLMTEPDVEPDGWELVDQGPLLLDNGRRVWVGTNVQQIDPYEPEDPPAGGMLTIHDPEEEPVACPGLVLVPIRVESSEPREAPVR